MAEGGWDWMVGLDLADKESGLYSGGRGSQGMALGRAVLFKFYFRKATPAAGSAAWPEGSRQEARERKGRC